MKNIAIRREMLSLVYLSKGQVEKYVEIDKRIDSEDLVDGKYSFNRYRIKIFLISNFLTELPDTDDMYKILNEFNNGIKWIKKYCLARQDEEIDDIMENASLVY